MQSGPIVAEIREVRERRAARFGYNIRAIVEDAQERDATGDRQVVRLPPRRPSQSLHDADGVSISENSDS